MSLRPDDFRAIRLKLASPKDILDWSHGEVIKPETINYRTQRPEKDGLFSEVIFGPEKDFQCYCGKYKKARYKGIVCDKCSVEVTRSIVRRERMGHITLASPVAHIWFLRKLPSKLAILLDIGTQDLEKIVYFANYVVLTTNEEEKEKALKQVKMDYDAELERFGIRGKSKASLKKDELKALRGLDEQKSKMTDDLKKLRPARVLSEHDYSQLSLHFPQVFEAGIGAEAVMKLCEGVELAELKAELETTLETATATQQKKLIARLKLVTGMERSKIRPEWMFFSVLPVIPPDLRPMVQLDGGRFASSDVNDLYRRVINRNNRLKKLIDLNAPEVILRNEKRMLQEAVDALIDNSARRGKAVMASTGQKRALKSLADMLQGKQGRFRRNLLGKRVDYSGRSVIVSGPTLNLDQCGIPKKMALEMFKPFVIAKLIERDLAHNVRGAGHLIDDGIPEVWDILEEVTKDRYVLLNRAPTLHRLGIQAFKPILTEGSAINLHPLVCSAFNADFDGDQMAVHLPLSDEAQLEAQELMLSKNNLLKPATGKPIAKPNQDVVLGMYYLTDIENEDCEKENCRYFANEDEAILAYQERVVRLREKIMVRMDIDEEGPRIHATTVGRILFNRELPEDWDYENRHFDSRALRDLLSALIVKYPSAQVADMLDSIKNLGFKFATKSGITWSMSDLVSPDEKAAIMERAEIELEKIMNDFNMGLLTESERKAQVIVLWHGIKNEIAEASQNAFDENNPIYTIINSGSRGSWGQVVQMIGMKGLVVNPAGEEIELPIKNSFKEGFNVLEYFNSTHGARKGTTDTALRTAAAGYLTRRLIDVAHDIMVKTKDCETKQGIAVYRAESEEVGVPYGERLFGRVILKAVKSGSKTLAKAGDAIDHELARIIEAAEDVEEIWVRSPITCEDEGGVCRECYGFDLGRNAMVEMGQAVGIISAQSIGEPGTQLTMRTFHMGGVAGSQDITQGLPRVEEILETRKPKVKALISEVDGKVESVTAKGETREIAIKTEAVKAKSKESELVKYTVPTGFVTYVAKGDLVAKGMQLTEGHVDLQELFKQVGPIEVSHYISKEIQKIYSSKGAEIHDKYIEVIARKMLSRITITKSGDSLFIPGETVDKAVFISTNKKLEADGKVGAQGRSLLLGITKVALTADSFLSAASFQMTAKALIDAALEGKIDDLSGLKENVIIGRLIPAGTGYSKLKGKLERSDAPATEEVNQEAAEPVAAE